MTALEIRIIAYAVLGLGLIIGSFTSGWEIESWHNAKVNEQKDAVQAARDKAADTALEARQAEIITAQKAQQTAEAAAEKEHETRIADNARLSSSLANSLRSLEAVSRYSAMSGPVAAANAGSTATTGTGSAQDLAAAFGRFNDAAQAATDACLADSDELAEIQSIAKTDSTLSTESSK